MEIIDKILELFENDKDYFIEFKIDSISFTAYLDNDPEQTFERKYVIPIRYDGLFGVYIPDDEFRELMTKNDVGITIEEIRYIKDIMELMLEHKDEIEKAMDKCGIEWRKDKNDD